MNEPKTQILCKSLVSFFEKRWIHISLIILLTFVVYANSFKNEFVYDDYEFVAKNESIRSLRNIPTFFFSYTAVSPTNKELARTIYRPLTIFSFSLDYLIWKLNPFGYHLTNLLFHISNAILIYFLMSLILKKNAESLFVALLFSVHPIQTEAVTWISSRRDVLFLFFFLFSFLLFVKDTLSRNWKYYGGSIISYIFALLSKEMAITLPFILILYEHSFIPKEKQNCLTRKISYYLPFFLSAGLYLLLRFSVLGSVSQRGHWVEGLYPTLLTMSKVIVYYIQLLFFPVKLSVEYALSLSTSIFEPKVLLSFELLILILIIGIKMAKKSKEISFSIFWFFIALLPVYNVLPLKQLLAERNLYLPSVGFSMLLTLLITVVFKSRFHFSIVPTLGKQLGILFFTFLLIFYSLRTIKRNTDWKDELTLWSKTAETFPQSAKAHAGLGDAYLRKGLYDHAIIKYKKAIILGDTFIEVYNNLGLAFIQKGDYESAIASFREAMELDSTYADAHYNLALAYLRQGMYGKAASEFKKVMEINPANINARKWYALAIQSLSQSQQKKE